MESERLLEDTLVSNPNLLMDELKLVGRQAQTEGGPLDLLGVDPDGRLVVFELKRGTLSRDAVAQVIDYASSLESMPDGELVKYISDRSGAHGVEKIGDFEEWYDDKWPGQELSALKPVRMVLVGLGVDATTIRMARFLATRGMDFTLLTFHGFVHEGKTLLARQVQVEAIAESDGITTPRRPGRREQRERLDSRVREHTKQWSEAQALWDAVLSMFRENFHEPIEIAGRGASDWSKHRLNVRIPSSRNLAAIQLGPFGPNPDLVNVIFFSEAVRTCLEEFIQLRRELPFQTWPLNSPRKEEGILDVQFPLKSLAEWEERKEKLAAITRSVYEAYVASED